MTHVKLQTSLVLLLLMILVQSLQAQKSKDDGGGDFKFLTADYVKYLSKENVAIDVAEMLELIDKFIVKLNKNKYLAVEEIENEIEYNKYLKERIVEINKLDRELAELKDKYEKWYHENEEIKNSYLARYPASASSSAGAEYEYFRKKRKSRLELNNEQLAADN